MRGLIAALCCLQVGLAGIRVHPADGREPSGSGRIVRLAVANLNHRNNEAVLVSQQLQEIEADVLILLEWTGRNARLNEVHPGLSRALDEPRSGTHGICVLARDGLEVSAALVAPPIETPCRLPLASIRFRRGNDWLSVLGIHAPPPVGRCASSTTPYLEAIQSWIDQGRLICDVGVCRRGDRVVVAGDLNALPSSGSIRGFERVGLVDAHRSSGRRAHATWSPGFGLPAVARIDYLFAPRELQVTRAWSQDLAGSDHDLLQAEFRWPAPTILRSTASYSSWIEEVANRRAEWARRWIGEPTERATVLEGSRTDLEKMLSDRILPRWLGTDWSFHGTSETPQSGSIACGYFVTTILRDSGFRIERRILAQQASENILRTLCDPGDIRRFSDVPIEEFGAAVRKLGPGIFILGLDQHTGFIVQNGMRLRFVHSSYLEPWKVVSEPLTESEAVRSSRYRVVGKIFSDSLLEKWLRQEDIPTLR